MKMTNKISNEADRMNQNPISQPAGQAVRPPIVVVLGHIDHGKSSLLEAIRDFKITEKESGGITQHIGAYQIEEQGEKITFLDTPGHEAFFQMRSRGAKVADIAILVIDAAEGIKTQTKEAIFHINEAGIPTIVALNKIDKPDAEPEKVKRELSRQGLLVESLGGKVLSLEISAKTGKGIPEILELILLAAGMEDLKADFEKSGEGVVIESYLDSLRGPTATLLLTSGHLKAGDIVATSSAFVKIKSLENFQKIPIQKALPSDPVIIFGFSQPPKVSERFRVFPDLKSAENYIQSLEGKEKTPEVLETTDRQRILNLVLKADFLGSIEAIEGILKTLPQEKVILRILKSGVGDINESDIKLALGGRAVILGFRVKADSTAKIMIEREKIKIMMFEVVYDLVENVRKFMEKIVKAEDLRTDIGKVKVLAVFISDKNRQIIGGRVIEGEVKKGALIEVFRPSRSSDGSEEKISQGKIINLQRNKKDAPLVSKGDECGILFEGDAKIEQGDILLIYTEEKVRGQL